MQARAQEIRIRGWVRRRGQKSPADAGSTRDDRFHRWSALYSCLTRLLR